MKTYAQTILIYYICAKYKIRMIRKFTAITLLSMASIVMLAFVVFPHHHHNEYICFATAHCQDEGENEEHSHDTGSSNHRCVKNLFQTQINRGQNVEHQSEEGAYHHFSLSLFLVSNILEFLSSEAEQQCDSDSYYQEKLHTACYISALAGRAPPFTV